MKSTDAAQKTNPISFHFFRRKITLEESQIKNLVPLCAVVLCAIIAIILLCTSLSHDGNVDGTFVLYGSSSSFVEFKRDGSYEAFGDEKEKGEWHFEGKDIVLSSKDGTQKTAHFVDQKYIAPLDDNFLYGKIGQGSFFDTEVMSKSGETYTFKADGKVYTTDDGRNTEFGTYMTDGQFIIVKTKNKSITYLNCGDGITHMFYKAS